MYLFLLALFFYLQNIVISLFVPFVFIPNIFEFLLLYILLLIISKFKYSKSILYSWQIAYLIHFSFLSYFGSTLTYIDIYLFFTHIEDTFLTLFNIHNILIIPFITSTIILIFIYNIQIKPINISYKILVILLFIIIYFIPKINDASFILINEASQIYKVNTSKINTKSNKQTLRPISQNDINIVLVLGESMRAKEFLENKYSIFEKYKYKTIYSGATNTDVSIPMLINGASRPTQIDFNHNLFYLAKQNNFNTTFISTQSKKSLKYIEPYLNTKYIDTYNIQRSLDINLLQQLNSIDLSQNNLVVLQMQGQHSPYLSYPNANESDNVKLRYKKSMNYSNKIIEQIISTIKNKSTKPYLFLFTSDHGEFIGENGRFGHNRFEKEIYKVPFFYSSSNNIDLQTTKNHADIYQIISFYLGYKESINYSSSTIIYGTMITEDDGFIQIKY
ncbi:MAG: sulfatase-like hydrolase/transferase [Campylobacteraceae bacterium]|jgi:hypothetical protein|nr:sulfatase-like hydrolase/transferase [Campylobacteraceae bacterium]MBT3881797.1 sulfatase-like hydrolase/transferase [Campylobacteraceae bacterium]MBT4179844.1 sulfatase-like hydrolase/transferase [Campylobacteraceae bacterium]MBT4708060.1 sulfatase-like hydrolase/transferase [Campylobacteraceae bacterium]MBT5324464.1 sulfatase-like hydrolase/transferase [Campylobacteraceae bacterium]